MGTIVGGKFLNQKILFAQKNRTKIQNEKNYKMVGCELIMNPPPTKKMNEQLEEQKTNDNNM